MYFRGGQRGLEPAPAYYVYVYVMVNCRWTSSTSGTSSRLRLPASIRQLNSNCTVWTWSLPEWWQPSADARRWLGIVICSITVYQHKSHITPSADGAISLRRSASYPSGCCQYIFLLVPVLPASLTTSLRSFVMTSTGCLCLNDYECSSM